MVRPIHSGGLVQHGPRVHFSPVVSQLRYKERQGSLRPLRKTVNKNYSDDNNSTMESDHNRISSDNHIVNGNDCLLQRVTVQVQEIIVPSPLVQKVRMPRNIHEDLTTSSPPPSSSYLIPNHSNNQLLQDTPTEVNGPTLKTTSSEMMDHLAQCGTASAAAHCQTNSTIAGGNNNKHPSLPLNGDSSNGHVVYPNLTFYGPEIRGNNECDTVASRNAHSMYGYEYYGYTYGLPEPTEGPTLRQSLPNESFRDNYNRCHYEYQKHNEPFKLPLTTSSNPREIPLDLAPKGSIKNVSSSADGVEEECGTGQLRRGRAADHTFHLSHRSRINAERKPLSVGNNTNFRKFEKIPAPFKCVREDDQKARKKSFGKSKFNFLQKLTFGRLGGGQSSSKSNKTTSSSSNRVSTSKSASQIVSLSSWPSIKGVVVSPRRDFHSPVQSSFSCAELCQRRRKSEARNPPPVPSPIHLSSLSGRSETQINRLPTAATTTTTVGEQAAARRSVSGVHPVHYPRKDNCLCIQRDEVNEWLAGKDSQPSLSPHSSTENNSIPSSVAHCWNPGADPHQVLNKEEQHEHPTLLEEKGASGASISQITLPSPSSPDRAPDLLGIESNNIERGNWVTESYRIDVPSKNVATSPVHHFSAFYALNLPVVPPRVAPGLTESPPTPPQRTRKINATTAATSAFTGTETESLPAISSTNTTDELSANVDKILDEIASLELECLSMELNASLLGDGKDHLRDGEKWKIKSFPSPGPKRDRMECGDEEPERGDSEQVMPVFGKPPLPPTAARTTSAIRQEFLADGDYWGHGGGGGGAGGGGGSEAGRMSGTELDVRLLKFRLQLYRSREELAKSHPNLEEMEDAVRSSMVIDRSRSSSQRTTTLPLSVYDAGRSSSSSSNSSCNGKAPGIPPRHHSTTTTTATTTGGSLRLSSGQIHRQRLIPDPVTAEKERCRAQEWSKLVKQVSENLHARRHPPSSTSCSSTSARAGGVSHGNAPGQTECSGIVETDLDTGASREIISGGQLSAGQLHVETYGEPFRSEWSDDHGCGEQDDDVHSRRRKSKNLPLSVFPDDGQLSFSLNQKTRSLLNLGSGSPEDTIVRMSSSHSSQKSATLTPTTTTGGGDGMTTLSVSSTSADERARSMEFLLEDSDKNAHLRPPENNLMMRQQENRQLSEHEVRIQRSLNKLNVPDWYKNYAGSGSGGGGTGTAGTTPTAGSKTKIFGSGNGLAGGWTGLSSSKTSSLTSLQSTGRYSGRTHFSRLRSTGTASTGGRSSRESLMSPSSTASASPSPYYERSSFTYGMPYALTRFASARMSCGASPASLSPSPSPVGGTGGGGSSTSTPVSSAPLSRHHSYSKAPYLGWRSQERLNTKQMYRTPAERLAADLLAHKTKTTTTTAAATSPAAPPAHPRTKGTDVDDDEEEAASAAGSTSTVMTMTATTMTKDRSESSHLSLETSPKKEMASASDLSLNNSEESNSHKLNRVRSSIKAVSNAIVDYVNESKPLDDGMNGGTSPRKGFVWLESSFVGTKPIDSPGTPDTPTVIMSSSRHVAGTDSGSSSTRSRNVFRFEDHHHHHHHPQQHHSSVSRTASSPSNTNTTNDSSSGGGGKNNGTSGAATASTYNPYHSRNEQMEERSNSSSVSSPTLDDILDSLLALRRPHKKIRARSSKGHSRDAPAPLPTTLSQPEPNPVSDWQERMNQPVLDTMYFPVSDDFFPTTSATETSFVHTSTNYSSSSSGNDPHQPNDNNVNNSYSTTAFRSWIDGSNAPSGADEVLSRSTRAETNNFLSNTFSHGDTGRVDPYEEHESSAVRAATSSTNNNNKNNNNNNNQVEGDVAAESKELRSDAGVELLLGRNGNNNTSSGSSISHARREPGDDGVDIEENAFGIPTEINTATTSSTCSAAVNAIASLNDSNPPTPARHRRVSFDLDISDKEEKSSSRSNRRDESVGGAIHCRNTKCAKTASGLEARREFKTCHNCNAYYCSRECRRAHWEKHKKVCMQSRVGALCKQIINHVKEDSFVVSQLSGVARRGFLAKGRGCVKLFFSSPDRAERFLTGGLPELPEPWYIPCGDILPEEMGAQTFAELSDQCRTYNGDNRFVLYVSVCVVNEVPTSGAVKWEREMISRSAKLRLLLPRNYEETQMHHQAASPAHLFPEEPHVPMYHHHHTEDETLAADEDCDVPPPLPPHHSSSDNDTLILRSVPAPTTHQLNRSEDKKLREVSFANIQRHLVERGVDLRRTFPEIYTKLCNYVEHDEPFLPVTIYPKNSQTGRPFVCVIMPDPSSNHGNEDLDTSEAGSRRVETVNISDNYELS